MGIMLKIYNRLLQEFERKERFQNPIELNETVRDNEKAVLETWLSCGLKQGENKKRNRRVSCGSIYSLNP
jgi:hypothetical protein